METTISSQHISDTTSIVGDTLTAWTKYGLESVTAGNGGMITIVGLLVVFISLAVLALFIKGLGKGIHHLNARTRKTNEREQTKATKNGSSGEVIAAIAVALQNYIHEIHDEEKTILTINRVSRHYSPWSAKLYSMRQLPNFFPKR